LALASHLFLDAFNSYGVHPFYPFQSRWYYGDAIFIFEPWFWLLFGLAAALNSTGRSARVAGLLSAALLPLLLVAVGLVPPSALLGFVIVGGLFGVSQRQSHHKSARGDGGGRRDAPADCDADALGCGARPGARILTPEINGELVDIILTPSPASPLCWASSPSKRTSGQRNSRSGAERCHSGPGGVFRLIAPSGGC
jgi:inner membrane protein